MFTTKQREYKLNIENKDRIHLETLQVAPSSFLAANNGDLCEFRLLRCGGWCGVNLWQRVVVFECCGINYLQGEGEARIWAEKERNQDSKSPKNKNTFNQIPRRTRNGPCGRFQNFQKGYMWHKLNARKQGSQNLIFR